MHRQLIFSSSVHPDVRKKKFFPYPPNDAACLVRRRAHPLLFLLCPIGGRFTHGTSVKFSIQFCGGNVLWINSPEHLLPDDAGQQGHMLVRKERRSNKRKIKTLGDIGLAPPLDSSCPFWLRCTATVDLLFFNMPVRNACMAINKAKSRHCTHSATRLILSILARCTATVDLLFFNMLVRKA